MLNLYRASRDDLINLLLAQREALADRDRRVAALEVELAALRTRIAHLIARLGEALAMAAPAEEGAPAALPSRGWSRPRGRCVP